MRTGARDMLGKPFAVGDGNEAILTPVPDRDGDAYRVKIELPRMHERQVVVEPSEDAAVNGVHQALVRLLRVLSRQRARSGSDTRSPRMRSRSSAVLARISAAW